MLRDHTAPKNMICLNLDDNLKQVSLQVLNVVLLLQEACAGALEEFTQQEIQRMIGIIRTTALH